MTSWLNKQRKQQLLELSEEAGLTADEDWRKDELIDALDDHLQKHATSLSRVAAFEPYYGTRRPSRPRESSAAGGVTSDDGGAKSAVRPRAKKPTKVKSEPEESSTSLSSPTQAISSVVQRITSASPLAATQTPAPRRESRLQASLPPSPAAVAEEIEQATTRFYASLGDRYAASGVPESIDWVRDTCSSVIGVHATFLLLEAFALQRAIFPWKYAFDLPTIPAIRFAARAVKLPDLFVLLSGTFWGPTLLWSATSIFIPLFFAYFYNLTVRPVKRNGARVHVQRYPYDPMTFSIVKAIVTSLVYGYQIHNGYFTSLSVDIIEHAIFAGHKGILAGCAISGIAALWEASQR